jgi:CheY-like chemotaxis protein
MGRRVLLVDDDVLILEIIAYMLADLGCDTVTARSGTEALGTIANDDTIEVLISDINMAGIGRIGTGSTCARLPAPNEGHSANGRHGKEYAARLRLFRGEGQWQNQLQYRF